MLIFLYGEDDFRLKKKIKEIVNQYQTKHQSGLNLIWFDEKNLDLDKIKETVEAVSMFDEKKLLILENVFSNKSFQGEFVKYIKKAKLKDNQDVVLVASHLGKLAKTVLNQASMFEEFNLLTGANLVNWISKEVKERGGTIDQEAITLLVTYVGNDLWQLDNELNKLLAYKRNQPIIHQDVDSLVRSKIDVNIFKTLDALAKRDKKNALKYIHQHFNQGENEIYLFSMLVYQVRTLLKLKDLIEKGTPFYNLAAKSGLHPYVVKKSSDQLRNFSLDQLKKIYQRLLEIDLKLKTGNIDGLAALDLLTVEI